MKLGGNIKRWFIGLAVAAAPLVTAASCDPYAGFNFFRDDDAGDYDDDCFFGCYYDDGYYYDDCYYDDCYYDESIIIYEKGR